MKTLETNKTDSEARDIASTRSQGAQVAEAAEGITRIAFDLAGGSRRQVELLNATVNSSNETVASLKDTTRRLESIAEFSKEIVSSMNENAASAEQIRGSSGNLASAIASMTVSIEETSRSIESVNATVQGMATSAEEVTGAMAEVSASIKTVSQDTEALSAAVNQTAASIEQISRSIDGLAANSDDLNVSAEQTSSSINAMAASIEEVSAMSENLSSNVESVSTSLEEMSRSVQGVAANAESISAAAAAAATNATQMDRSLRSVASVAKRAEEVSKRLTKEAEDGGAAAQKSIQGMARVRQAMEQSAQVIREMGKKSEEIGGIVNTINVLAERTNMLSLNASIEAARAGDAGRGFSVVAEEIRNLADRSAQATSDIAAIIRSLQEVVREAVLASSEGTRIAEDSGRLADDGAVGLQRMLAGIRESSDIIAQIFHATEEQLLASQNVVTSVETTATQSRQAASAVVE